MNSYSTIIFKKINSQNQADDHRGVRGMVQIPVSDTIATRPQPPYVNYNFTPI